MTFFGCDALNCVSMNNQDCKLRQKIININSNEPSSYPYRLKYVNAAVIVIISIIHMQNYVFLMLVKTWMNVFKLISRTNEPR